MEADRKRSSIYSKSFDKFVKSMMELMAESLQNDRVTQASIFTIIYDYHKAIIRRDMVKDRVIGHFNKRTNKSVMKNMFKVVKQYQGRQSPLFMDTHGIQMQMLMKLTEHETALEVILEDK